MEMLSHRSLVWNHNKINSKSDLHSPVSSIICSNSNSKLSGTCCDFRISCQRANLAIPHFCGSRIHRICLLWSWDLTSINWNRWDCRELHNLHKLQRPFTTNMGVEGITRWRTLLFLFMTETCRGCRGS